jgi:hypothetical protein
VVIGDIDEITGLDILSGAWYSGLYSWESDCDSRAGSPVLHYGEVDGTPFIADVDKNDGGRLEMITKDLSGRVYVYDLKSTGPIEWGQFAHDLRHTSWYDASFIRTDSSDRVDLTLDQNIPNPFNPETLIHFSVPRFAHVTLDIYDVAGRNVARLVDAPYSAGSYSTVWRGRNMGNRCDSPVLTA